MCLQIYSGDICHIFRCNYILSRYFFTTIMSNKTSNITKYMVTWQIFYYHEMYNTKELLANLLQLMQHLLGKPVSKHLSCVCTFLFFHVFFVLGDQWCVQEGDDQYCWSFQKCAVPFSGSKGRTYFTDFLMLSTKNQRERERERERALKPLFVLKIFMFVMTFSSCRKTTWLETSG